MNYGANVYNNHIKEFKSNKMMQVILNALKQMREYTASRKRFTDVTHELSRVIRMSKTFYNLLGVKVMR